jgi:thiol-disulfide isomerase/thioredoxin
MQRSYLVRMSTSNGSSRRVRPRTLVLAALLAATSTFTALNLRDSVSSAAWAKPAKIKVVKAKFNVDTPYAAPEFTELQNWINSDPLALTDLKGKVVIVNFWTFGCVNCQNTLPYVRDLYARYHDKGLEIVGLHAPEFGYEKEIANVRKAVKDDGIKWPVAQDNGFKTWRRYKNGFWPSFFFIDKTGKVRHTHIGEGGYDNSDAVVAALLAEPGPATS